MYDLYDLGEFDQKGTRSTKWGTKEELVQLCIEAKKQDIGVLWDAVLNHRCAGDEKEPAEAVVVDPKGMCPPFTMLPFC